MYGISRKLTTGFEEAVPKVRKALENEGFGVLTEIDVKDTLRKKLDVDFRKYIILGACNPPLAHQALSTELGVGLLLPCNVIVYENDEGGTNVSAIDPFAMFRVVENEALNAVVEEANARLGRAMEAL